MTKGSKHSNIILKRAMSALGVSSSMKTNPRLIRSILKEMELYDFNPSFAPMRKFLKEIKNKPKSLRPMLENIKKGLLTKHPAIIEFLELAVNKKWLSKSKQVTRTVHITFILEAMTAAMCNSHAFLLESEKHYRLKLKKHGLDRNNISKSLFNASRMFSDFFKVAKLLSIDPIMIYFRLQKGLGDSLISVPDLKKLYKNKKINFFEYKLLFKLCDNCTDPANKLVRINIYEAGTTEYKSGFKINAISAHSLAQDLKNNSPKAKFSKKSVIPQNNIDKFYKTITKKGNVFLDIAESQDWSSLYITWNMAFVLGNLSNLDLLFPKLLIPSIINSKSNNFLGVRVISLWLSINHFLFRKSKNLELTGPSNKIEMAQAWGKINKKYAFDLAKNKSGIGHKELMSGYAEFFVHPFFRIFKLLKSFFKRMCK